MRARILFITYADAIHASSRVRVLQCIPHFERAGITCTVLNLWPTRALGLPRYVPVRARAGLRYPVRMAAAWRLAARHDLTYVNLALFPVWFQRALARQNRGVVFDFVDPIYLSSQTPDRHDREQRHRFEEMIRTAVGVVTGNAAGREIAAAVNRRVVNVVGPIDTDRFRPAPARRNGAVVIGWIGTPSTTRYLSAVAAPLREVLARHPEARIELVGASAPPLDGLPVTMHRWSESTEVGRLQQFDIGIMPLPDNPWTRGKGGYKLLQYMATGLPTVASPVGINETITRHGENGLLASNDRDWIAMLSQLISDAALRGRLGAQGRRDAEERYALSKSVPRVVELFEGILS